MDKIKALVIAPYEGLKETFLSVIPNYSDQIDFEITIGDLNSGLEIAKELEDKYDVIISRGGTASLIRENVHTLVLSVEISGYDYVRIIKMAENIKGKKALVGFSNVTQGAKNIKALVPGDLDIFTISDKSELFTLLKGLKDNHYQLIIGDTAACSVADELNLNNLLLISGEESVKQCIAETINTTGKIKELKERVKVLEKVIAAKGWQTALFDHGDHLLYVFPAGGKLLISEGELRKMLDSRHEDFLIDTDNGYISGVLQTIDSEYTAVHMKKVWDNQKSPIQGVSFQNLKAEKDKTELTRLNVPQDPKLFDFILAMGKGHKSVLLVGDPGVGKSDIALAIHQYSAEWDSPFIKIDCALIKAEELDTFLSPMLDRRGTIFLSYIEQLDEKNQRYILGILKKLDRNRWRIIGSAAPGINNLIGDRHYNLDLYNLISEMRYYVPNIAECKEGVEERIKKYILKANEMLGRQIAGIDDDALELLTEFQWAQNFTQLEQVINQLVLLSPDYYIHADSVRVVLMPYQKKKEEEFDLSGSLEEIDRRIIEKVLAQEEGNISKTAQRLRISRSTIWRKLREGKD